MIDDITGVLFRDSVTTTFAPHQSDVVDEEFDGDAFQRDSQSTVTVDDEEWQDAFETDTAYRITAVVARPIKQEYQIDDETFTFKKPASELQKAATWLDNVPFTVRHPTTGTVKTLDQVHGVWRDPEWDADSEELRATLYIPSTDDDALDWVEQHSDVSVGFYNSLDEADEDGVDAYQTELYFDHVAGVTRGRCSGEDGCGLELDSAEGDTTDSGTVQMTVADDDVSRPDVSVVESLSTSTKTMCDKDDCTCDGAGDVVSDLSLDAIAERNEKVDEIMTDREELEAEKEELAADKADLEDKVEMLQEQVDDLQDSLDEYERAEKQEYVDEILSYDKAQERWDEDDLYEKDTESLKEDLEFVEGLAATDKVANPSTDSESTDETKESKSRNKPRTNLDLSSQ